MKRTLVLFALIMLVSAAFAQMKKDRTSAYNYWKKKDLVKAKEFIDKAVAYPEAATDAKVWYYKGNIYLDIYKLAVTKTKIEIGMPKIQVYGILGEPNSVSKTTTANGINELLFYNQINSTININEKGLVDYINEIPSEKAMPIPVVPDALDIAYESYIKARTNDTKGEFSTDIAAYLTILGGEFFNSGISYFQQNNFDGAMPFFEKAIKIKTETHEIDTLANYGSALCLEKKAAADKAFLDKAIAQYQFLVDIKMKEVSIYTSLANLYKDKGAFANDVKIGMNKDAVISLLGQPKNVSKTTTAKVVEELLVYDYITINIDEKGKVNYINQIMLDKASEIINLGKVQFPGNTDLIITEANMYISTNNHAKAVASLMVAKEKEPNNVSVLYAIGVTYDLLKNDTKLPEAERTDYFNKAISSYKETIALDANYFDALFNLGAIYFNKGGDVINEASKLPFSEEAKFNKMTEEGNNYLNLALPYLENCEKLQPKDKPTLTSLKEIYMRLKMTEKFSTINAKINDL